MSQKRTENKPWDRDLEAEAAYLEQQALTHIEAMPEEDEEAEFARLMERIEERKKAAKEAPLETMPAWSMENVAEGKIPGRPKRHGKIRWKILGVLAAILVLLLAVEFGTVGKKVYTPEAVVEHRDGEVVIKVNNDVRIEREVEEEEIYQEINDRLGILSLRLGYKPKGAELYGVEIFEDAGEATIYFLYKGDMIFLYMSRDYLETGNYIKPDGKAEVINTVDNFILNEKIDIIRTQNEEEKEMLWSEISYDNVLYIVSGNVEMDEFLKIIEEIYRKNM